MRLDQEIARYSAVADRKGLTYAERLAEYRRLADRYFEVDRYQTFTARHLAHLDEATVDFFESAEFDDILVATVRDTFPPHEHESFVAHYRGLVAAWCGEQRSPARARDDASAEGR